MATINEGFVKYYIQKLEEFYPPEDIIDVPDLRDIPVWKSLINYNSPAVPKPRYEFDSLERAIFFLEKEWEPHIYDKQSSYMILKETSIIKTEEVYRTREI